MVMMFQGSKKHASRPFSSRLSSLFSSRTDEEGHVPWWRWLFIALAAPAIVVLVKLLQQNQEMERVSVKYPPAKDIVIDEPAPVEEAPIVAEPEAEKPAAVVEADDLRKIEGIGPKISMVLKDAGILTFSRLAETDVQLLREILDQAGIRIADPETWPEQASLAAKEDWEGLQALQSTLKGGRRI
jgi:predicted flap endonuclease-1-like 5' DNA nuclease